MRAISVGQGLSTLAVTMDPAVDANASAAGDADARVGCAAVTVTDLGLVATRRREVRVVAVQGMHMLDLIGVVEAAIDACGKQWLEMKTEWNGKVQRHPAALPPFPRTRPD